MRRKMAWLAAVLVCAAGVGPVAAVRVARAQATAPASPAPDRRQLTQGSQAAGAAKDDLTGIWQGTLNVGNGLRTMVKVTKDDAKYKAVFYSIDQGGQPIAVTSMAAQGGTVTLAITGLDLTYTGTLNPDGNSMTGSVTQHGDTHPLNLARVSAENAWAIPEPPKPMAADAKPKFDVVTVKPGQPNSPGKNIGFRGRDFMARNFNVNDLIALGYGLHVKQIVGAPEWFNSELFDIQGVPDVPGVPNHKQQGLLMQDLLMTRFGLKFHTEQRELAVFAITVGKTGPKMTVTAAGPDDGQGFGFRSLGDLTVRNMTIADFAGWMQASVMDRPVVDQTGLKDRYDFTLKWTPDDSQFAQFRTTGALPSTKDDPNAPPALNDAVQQQLGLRIEPVKAMDEVMVIDHADQPGAN